MTEKFELELKSYLRTGNSVGDSMDDNCLAILLLTTLFGRDIFKLFETKISLIPINFALEMETYLKPQ